MTYYGARELAESFRTVRRNTIAVAEDIPESQYGYSAAQGYRTVAQILSHITINTRRAYDLHAVRRLSTFVGMDFLAYVRQWAGEEAALTTKALIVEALRTDGERWAGFLESLTEDQLGSRVTFPEGSMPPSKSRFELALSVKEHEMHHRGQLMVIERLLGLVPHLTREREARIAAQQAGR